MSADGRICCLVFSGDDNFAAHQMDFAIS